MRIVHISDIHVGLIPRSPRALFDKRLLGAANYLLRRARSFHEEYLHRAIAEIYRLAPELVLCTGDITSVGSPEEHEAACALLEPLRAALGSHFLYVPGNHDAYVRDRACLAALERSFRHLNSDRWDLADLPVEWSVAGLRLLLLDAAQPVSWFLSSGAIPARAAAWIEPRLLRVREEGECRVLVTHFPLRRADGRPLGRRRRMLGADMLLEFLRQGRLDAVLSGHIHVPFARWQSDGRGEVCAGSLTLNGCFSVLDWTPGTVHFRQFFVDVTGLEPDLPALGTSLVPVS